MAEQMEAPASSEQPAPHDAAASKETAGTELHASPSTPMDAQASESAAGPPPVEHGGGEPGAPAEASPSLAEESAAADGEGKAKRKRRRKRKRKGAGEGEAAEAGAEDRKKEASHAPFAHLFAGVAAGKRHAFAAGEVVAGRVIGLADGVIHIDLFGKATAVADEFEPREVPAAPEPVPGETVGEQATGGPEEASGAAVSATVEGSAPLAEVAAEPTSGVAGPDNVEQDQQLVAPAVEVAPHQVRVEAGSEVPSAAEPPAPAGVDAVANGVASSEQGGAETAAPVHADAPVGAVEEVAAGDDHGTSPAAVPAASEAGAVATAGSMEGDEVEGDADSEGAKDEDTRGPLAVAPVVPEEYPRVEPPTVGAIFKGRVGSVSESGHIVLVNRNIDRPAVRAAIARYREERRRVEGLVYGYNRGGFDVLVQGIRAFCPASAMSLTEIRDPHEFLGKKVEFLLPVSKGGKDIVVSRRSILERQARKRAKELLRSLAAGQTLTGVVTSVREFGLFVDIGGIEGLVHQSELSHGFGIKPADVAKVGDEVQVQVLRVGSDPGRKSEKRERVTRVSLSMKALQADPWDDAAEAVAEGTVREGKVTRTTDFGAFIELAPNIEGLLHISELGRDLQHADQAIAEGETVFVVVERADRKSRRISLSRLSDSELSDYREGKLSNEGSTKSLRPGARIEVVVERADHRGVYVRVAGVIGRRSRGFMPASETGTDRGSDLRKAFPPGETVEVKVIGQDRDGGLKCSVKALAIDDERRAVKDYRREASKQGFGTFGDLLRAKLGQAPGE